MNANEMSAESLFVIMKERDLLKIEIERLKAENDYLRHFRSYADFGPAHSEVVESINRAYAMQGKTLPPGWGDEE